MKMNRLKIRFILQEFSKFGGALNCGIGSSFLKANVSAFDEPQIVATGTPRL